MNTSPKQLIPAVLAFILLNCASANAAVVSFLGTIPSGISPGPVLNSFPRDFKLTYNYTPSPTGLSTVTSSEFIFDANGSDPKVIAATVGGIAVVNDGGVGGQDFFTFTGNIPAGLLGPTKVNYSFTFLNPSNTISSNDLNPTSVALLIGGQTTINFSGPLNAQGVIRGAPEPSTMIALTGLVAGGCGIGYRRRLKKAKQGSTEDDS